MARSWRAGPRLGFLVLLFAAAAADEGFETNKKPGDIHYCVTLQSLGVSEGLLDPEFDGEHEDYELNVPNSESKEVVVTLGLDLNKYDLQHTPVIEVDGEPLKYTPLTIISTTILLNEEIGPFDRVVHILIRDPNLGTWWHHTNRKEYRIHIRQPPEYSKIVRAEDLVLTVGDGREIEARPPFNPNSSTVDYYYKLNGTDTSVTVEFACPKFATTVKWNGEPQQMITPRHGWSPAGIKRTIDFTKLTQDHVSIACLYKDDHMSRRDYMLTIERNVHLSSHLIRPGLLPDVGYCMTRMDYMAKLQSTYLAAESIPSEDEQGYFCLTSDMHPKIMVDSEDPLAQQAEIYFKSKDFQVQLQSYLPTAIPFHHARHQFTMSVHLGSHQLQIPVNFIFSAQCTTMFCPKHYTQRASLQNEVRASKILCLAETCKEAHDLDTCCEEVASCEEMSCPDNKDPASQLDCAAPSCSDVDVKHCCLQHERCSDVDCPLGYTLRIDARSSYCSEKVCTAKDSDVCCEKQATCGDFNEEFDCPAGEPMPPHAENRHCNHIHCTAQDMLHCCGEVASCSGYKCPAGLRLRNAAAQIHCFGSVCSHSDSTRCCTKIITHGGQFPVTKEQGTIIKVNSDGTYAVNYTDGNVDESVPEWALTSDKTIAKGINLRPGESVLANTAEDGYHHHTFETGWVRQANADGTYTVEFDNSDWDKHVPAWAVRAVDSKGNRFVHTGMVAAGQRVYTSRKKTGGYKKLEFAVGTITFRNDDDTFTVQYSSGDTDEHVPAWDLRGIDANGHSHAQPDFKVGDYVEVTGQTSVSQHQFQPRLEDQLRTNYLFGFVTQVNADHTYGVKYDFGGWESAVPLWAIRKLENGESHFQADFKKGERVEARVSSRTPGAADQADKLGIAVRERMHLYQAESCWPEPQECTKAPNLAPGMPLDTAEKVPPIGSYDVASNPDDLRLCFYDDRCEGKPDLPGCNASMGGKTRNCRYCGFGDYPACPKPFYCGKEEHENTKAWKPERRDWCCKYYNEGCPYVCRWGKYWPEEARAWGPWWSPEKRTWCCEHKRIGCPRLDHAYELVTTTKPVSTTTITAACDDGFALEPVEPGDCPDNLADLEPCEEVNAGALCWGSGACGTSIYLNNCNKSGDVYRKQVLLCPNDQGVSGYRFSHVGSWVGGVPAGVTDSAAHCGLHCDTVEDCVAFSWQRSDHSCFVHSVLRERVLGSPSDSFLKCTESEMLDINMKFDGDSRSQVRQDGADEAVQGTVFRGSGRLGGARSALHFLGPLGLAGTCALALAAWGWRARGRRRRSGRSLMAGGEAGRLSVEPSESEARRLSVASSEIEARDVAPLL